MKKMMILALALTGALVACNGNKEQKDALADTTQPDISKVEGQRDSLMNLIGDISQNLLEVNRMENILVSGDFKDTPDKRQEIIANINALRQPEPEEDVAEVTAEQVADGEYDNEQEPMVELVLDDEPTAEPDAETPNVADETEDVEAEDNIEEEPEANEKASGDSEPLRLDEKLQRSRSKDLKSAFSLNDTFRFRRELFGNSAAEMTDAIHMVEAMHSFDEAEDYFYGDLGWDRESDDVKDFMAIIKNHFL